MTDAVENQYIEMAYARVSSKNQTLARQEASILNAVPDLKAKYFYKDKWRVYQAEGKGRGTYGSKP